jgi:hypothetical protein
MENQVKKTLSDKIRQNILNFLDWIAKGHKNTPACRT